MPAFINLIDKTFGRLTVISRAANRRVGKAQKSATFWLCKCSCGVEKEIMGGGLKNGAVLSCGCFQKEKSAENGKNQLIDISGKSFGKLKVLKRAKNRGTKIYWLVQCSCGSDPYEVESLKLRNNRSKCPECSQIERTNDLTGMVFGKWKVLKRVKNVNDRLFWLAQCSCGSKPKILRSDYFTNTGSATDCGCTKNEFNQSFVGQKFGKLTVAKWVKNNVYLCVCECGCEKKVKRNLFLNGYVQSCGCLQKEKNVINFSIDITNERFGKWTAIRRVGILEEENSGLWECACDCGNIAFRSSSTLRSGHTKSCGCDMPKGDDHHNYIGGKNFGGYDFYSQKIGFIEENRRCPSNQKAIQVKCTLCNNWFTPTSRECKQRTAGIFRSEKYGEGRFYCSEECKTACSIYGQRIYPKGFKPQNERQEIVDSETRNIALDRDGHQCQKCGSCFDLEVHHIDGVMQSPMTANDLDNCITVCQDCHDEIHAQPGCTYHDYQREACDAG